MRPTAGRLTAAVTVCWAGIVRRWMGTPRSGGTGSGGVVTGDVGMGRRGGGAVVGCRTDRLGGCAGRRLHGLLRVLGGVAGAGGRAAGPRRCRPAAAAAA